MRQPTQAEHSPSVSVSHSPAITQTPVPFLDLGPSHDPLKASMLDEISALIDTGAFTNGPDVSRFEAAFAEFCGTAHAVGLGSGLDALRLALLADGIERGDEVIVPAHTFVATFEAVTQAGGVPVPVDVSEHDYNIDVDAVEAAVAPRTRFVIPVHLYGQMADMARLGAVAERHALRVIEDACQAHGAERDGLRAGAAGAAGAFSFYPGKNLGAMGDAGALVTDESRLADAVACLREHGQRAKYEHELEGYTSRLDTIQALVLLQKLPLLAGWNEERRTAARFYDDALDGVGDLRLPPVPPGSNPVWHIYAIRTEDPSALGAFLRERGVGTGRHYPQPPHLSPAYAWLGQGDGVFPLAEALAEETLSLPMFPGITQDQRLMVAEAIGEFFRRG